LPKASPQQLAWQDTELGMFFHFDIPVFTDLSERDWPQAGHLSPDMFNPTRLDTDQWMEAAEAMGARYAVFVAKHCSGFLNWQSDLYPYVVKRSKWRGGQGDIVRDFVKSCHRYGIKPGLYCSMVANAYREVSGSGLVNWGKGGWEAAEARSARWHDRGNQMAVDGPREGAKEPDEERKRPFPSIDPPRD
jgi:alpha-L-fucosidase